MDINQKEKELFADWYKQVENDENIYAFPKFDENAESFFVKHQNDNYLMEYDFDSLPEVKSKLQEMWEGQEYMQKITTPVLVATMKNKPVSDNAKKDDKPENVLPSFIYNF